MKTFGFISILILGFASGDVLVTKGMRQVGEVSTLNLRKLLSIFWSIVRNSYILTGAALELLALAAYLAALSWADLSLVLPLTALSDVVVLIPARYFLRENVGLNRWVGMLFIGVGVALISLS